MVDYYIAGILLHYPSHFFEFCQIYINFLLGSCLRNFLPRQIASQALLDDPCDGLLVLLPSPRDQGFFKKASPSPLNFPGSITTYIFETNIPVASQPPSHSSLNTLYGNELKFRGKSPLQYEREMLRAHSVTNTFSHLTVGQTYPKRIPICLNQVILHFNIAPLPHKLCPPGLTGLQHRKLA